MSRVLEHIEKRVKELEQEYEKLKEDNPHILMAKREHLNGMILAYRSVIRMIKSEGEK